jgi:hypothetical protein
MQNKSRTLKLRLGRETLAQLSGADLARVAGGVISERLSNCRTCATRDSCLPQCI